MTHRFPIKEIARQSGLGTATIDRVLNGRANVSPQTRLRVQRAIDELAQQETQLAAKGRRLFFDFLIEAPTRFSREVKAAAESVLPHISMAVCRPRFQAQEVMSDEDVVTSLQRIAKRGSHGVCLKARDTEKIQEALSCLIEANIPVVTLVTDISCPDRLAYVGLDNRGAGRTAAYLVSKALGEAHGSVLTSRSHEHFSGEEERKTAFVEALSEWCPNLQIIDSQGGRGMHAATSQTLQDVMEHLPDLRAVYSVGGGNRSILDMVEDYKLRPDLFIAHDLDRDNRYLIENGRLDFILHHDLVVDMRNVFAAFLGHHNLAAPPSPKSLISQAQLITPQNIPV